MMRIQEKILFKGKSIEHSLRETIDETLESEEEGYKTNVKAALSEIKSLKFEVSDMVRGKCGFSDIEDILNTIQDIKKYIHQKNLKNPGILKLLEVESRFTRSPPISDITLKIVI